MYPVFPNSPPTGPLACHCTVPTGMGLSPSVDSYGRILDSIVDTGFRVDTLGNVHDRNGFLTEYVIKNRHMYDRYKNPLLI